MRIIRNIFLLACLSLAGWCVYFITCTQPGLVIALHVAARYLPGQLSIAKIDGTLLTRWQLKTIQYKSPYATATIDSVNFTLFTNDLWHGKLHLQQFIIQNALITISPITSTTPSAHHTAPTQLSETQLPDWPAFLRIDQVDIKNFVVNYGKNQFSLNGHISTYWQLAWTLNAKQLEAIDPTLHGTLTSHGTLAGPLRTPTLDLQLQAHDIEYPNFYLTQFTTHAHIIVQPTIDSTLHLNLQGLAMGAQFLSQIDIAVRANLMRLQKALQLRANITLNHQPPLQLAISLPQFYSKDWRKLSQPITGQLQTTLPLSSIPLPDTLPINQLKGTLATQLTLSGTLAQPIITGTLHIKDGRINVPDLGITPDRIQLEGVLAANHLLSFHGTLHCGAGDGKITGRFNASAPGAPLQLQLQGTRLTVANLPAWHVTLSPDVNLQLIAGKLNITGKIFIPHAQLALQKAINVVSLPEDVIFIHEGKAIKSTVPFSPALQLEITLGKPIKLAWQDLRAELGGQLHLSMLAGGALTATGELFVLKNTGTYHAYGQTLHIQTGRLIYTGGLLTNPGLNIVANKQIQGVAMSSGGSSTSFNAQVGLGNIYAGKRNIIVGIRVTGFLDQPIITPYSNPTMSDADVVSWLIFDSPASNMKSGALLAILSTMTPGNGLGSNKLIQSVQKSFGFSEFDIQSIQVYDPIKLQSINTSTLVIGKQLAKKLSAQYSAGLFYPVSILNVRYQLSQHWVAQSESRSIDNSMDNGADIIYQFERD